METSNRARDHLANERTFLAWVRTGLAIVVFGFAIGRFGVAIRQFMELQGVVPKTTGLSVWFGTISIVAGVAMVIAGMVRYQRTRDQLETGQFEPAGSIVVLVTLMSALLGTALAVYLVFVELNLH